MDSVNLERQMKNLTVEIRLMKALRTGKNSPSGHVQPSGLSLATAAQ